METSKPLSTRLFGAIAGDIIGSVYEFARQKEYDFPLFSDTSSYTDDSILTIAVADAILNKGSYLEYIQKYARAYPNPVGGYGGRFREWIHSRQPQPYNSFGNGSAMRVSAVGWAFGTVAEVLREAELSAVVTHNHPEGIKGAQAAALCVFLARKKEDKANIKREVVVRFGYDLNQTLDEIRPAYRFDETCQGTVPQALIAFFESRNFEDAIRGAVSLGGDADTLGAITGSIAEAYYGVPAEIVAEVRKRLDPPLLRVVERFQFFAE